MKRLTLNNARLIWRSPLDRDTVSFQARQTFCFKLTTDASGVATLSDGDVLLHSIDPVFDKPRSRFLLPGGGHCEFQRKFFKGVQVASFLFVKDYALRIEENGSLVYPTFYAQVLS